MAVHMHLTEFGNVRKVLAGGVSGGGEETQDTLSSRGKHLFNLGGKQEEGGGEGLLLITDNSQILLPSLGCQ